MISRYKEVDTASYRRSDDVANLLEKVQRLVQEHMHKVHADSASLISPHLIDLAPDGYIGKLLFVTVCCSSQCRWSAASTLPP